MTTVTTGLPHSGIDPFSDEVLDEPYDSYAEIRNAGPVVYLDKHDVFALGRFDNVRDALRSWRRLTSTEGPAFNPAKNELLRGSVVCSDPPEHEALRSMMVERLGLTQARALAALAERNADRIVAALVEQGSFDAVKDLAETYVPELVGELVGIPAAALEQFVVGSDAGFTTNGPMNARTEEGLSILAVTLDILYGLTKEDLTPGSMGWHNFEAAERHEIPAEARLQVLWNYTGPGFHTTITAIGNLIWLLCRHPDQWDLLKEDPALAPAAVNEALRLESPIQIWSRYCRQDVDVEGCTISGGSRVAVLLGSANRDDRHYHDPEVFDIRRNPVDHLSFGQGIHLCVGAHLARVELVAVLRALLEHASGLSIAGEPKRARNNTARGFATLPVVVA